jgi:Cu-processing system permease protein
VSSLTATSPRARATERRPRFEIGNVLIVARKEIRESLRNRWFILYTIAFAALSLALSALSLVGTGAVGFAGFGRTAASLINLVLLIVPLMALTTGAAAVAGERERGTLNYLLSQPVSRLEVILGKYAGLAVALMAALMLGFGIAALAIASRSGAADALRFARLVVFAIALSMSMLSVGFLISTVVRRASVALGAAIFIWLALVFVGDLGLMGSAIAFKLQVADLFHLSLANPLQVFKMAALGSVNASLDVLGPAGLYGERTFGAALGPLFAGVLGAWIVLPLALATLLFLRRGGA